MNILARIVRVVSTVVVMSMLTLVPGCADPVEPLSPSIADAGRSLFQHRLIDRFPPGGRDCCTDVAASGDINGDGYVDLVIGSEGTSFWNSGLVWYEYPAWDQHPIGRGEFTTDGEVVDFDGDADADIVIGDISRGLVWFEQTAPDKWRRHFITDGYVHDIHVADLNADGRQDVVIADKQNLRIAYRTSSDGYRIETLSGQKGEGLGVADLDADGDTDILYSNLWLENRSTSDGPTWRQHSVSSTWTEDTRTTAADVDRDGRLDVVLTGSEGPSYVSWFSAPADAAAAEWEEHRISDVELVGVHSLVVADIDLDGDDDVVVAEMHTSPEKRIVAYLNEGGSWKSILLASHGSHNMIGADVDGDGDSDLLGKNYAGGGRFVEIWENRARELQRVPDKLSLAGNSGAWSYAPIDTSRPAYDRQKFGLVLADVNSDGRIDVTAGGTLYVNTENAGSAWPSVVIGESADIIHATLRRSNGWNELIAVSADAVNVASATDPSGKTWTMRRLGSIPSGRTQGWTATPPAEDGSQTLYFTRAMTLQRLDIPGGRQQDWRLKVISEDVQEEGVAVGDLDGDGDKDIVATSGNSKRLLIMELNGESIARVRPIGASTFWLDRVELADMNSDGRPDVVFTEENSDGYHNARVGWLEAPTDPWSGQWISHTIVVLRSANSMTVGDHDGDGDIDVYVAEHTDTRPGEVADDNFTGVFLNQGDGSFRMDVAERGSRSSHLGARAADLDGDGVPDIVSAGWEQDCCVHRWTRADATPSAESQQ